MTKCFLAMFLALFMITPVIEAQQRGRQQPPRRNQNNIHHYGYSYRGHNYNHICYRSTWRGYSNRLWCVRYNCWCFWCPIELVWYRYDGVVFIPCEELVNPNGPY